MGATTTTLYDIATNEFREKRKAADKNKNHIHEVSGFMNAIYKAEKNKIGYKELLCLHRADIKNLRILNYIRQLGELTILTIAKSSKIKITEYVMGYIRFIRNA